MLIVDAHCDTLIKVLEKGENLFKNTCHVDIQRMRKTGKHVRFFAAYVSEVYGQAYAMKRAVQLIDTMHEQAERFKDDIALCLNFNDITNALKEGRVAAILSIENAIACQGELASLRAFYRLGVRSICLTWNHRNEVADGVNYETSGGGLTPFGREFVKEMHRLGMLVDVSHMSERGFWDAVGDLRHPVIASHSNARKVCRHKRNLTDSQILAIKACRGVLGINLYPDFLSDSGTVTLTDIIRHIEHICGLAGDDCIGLGTDFDGIEMTPSGIKGVEDIEIIFNELARLNYSKNTIEKIAGKNFMRVIAQVLGG